MKKIKRWWFSEYSMSPQFSQFVLVVVAVVAERYDFHHWSMNPQIVELLEVELQKEMNVVLSFVDQDRFHLFDNWYWNLLNDVRRISAYYRVQDAFEQQY